ncbi:hypothetical protein CNY67_03120 [Desulfovibrio sp. G11]|uniref:hypothetical protein n=1 Tax=Desulfovibrio desulfuricans TaxID=876 RepID=UPI000931D08C|nr:hypothetical protein [Desulfovibrio desulfuricans]ATD80533.1 hypothetical protein CNY67_03120 [Desulfovibrio sp. G11]
MCERLEGFLVIHWKNGITRDAGVIEPPKRMKVVDAAAWVGEEAEKATCLQYSNIKQRNEHDCPCRK